MDRGTQHLSSAPIDPGGLIDLVDELRDAGFNVGSDQYVAAHDLLLLLTARGEGFDSGRLESMLGPLLCSTPWEQEDFGDRFESWISRVVPVVTGPNGSDPDEPGLEVVTSRQEKGSASKSRLLAFILAVVTLVAATVLHFYTRDPLVELTETHLRLLSVPKSPVEAEGEAPPGSWRLALLGLQPNWPAWFALATVLFAFGSGWRHCRSHLVLSRWAVLEKPRIHQVAVDGLRGQLFHGVSLARTAQELRRRRTIPSKDLDISLTVGETVRQAGWLAPVYGTRQLIPEYLMLVDRISYRDQQAKFVDAMIERLRATGVLISRYYFDADPRVCFSFVEGASTLTLRELANRYPDHHLLVFSDAAGLFNSRSGDLEPWAEQFSRWSSRAIMTPIPRAHWGPREAVLFRQFATLPATPTGLASLIRSTGRDDLVTGDQAAVPLPRDLQTRPLRWLKRRPPAEPVVRSTLSGVRRYLDDSGFYWLAACAVYPALDWNLTLYLGNRLKAAGGQKLLQLRRLTALARLPWFRHGYMPDWLRERLLTRISSKQQEEIRGALQSLLESAVSTQRTGFSLQIARARLMTRILANRSKDDSLLRDYVFATVMAGRRLGVPVPEAAGDAFPGPLSWLLIRLDRIMPRLSWGEVLCLLCLLLLPISFWDRIPGLLFRQPSTVEREDPIVIVELPPRFGNEPTSALGNPTEPPNESEASQPATDNPPPLSTGNEALQPTGGDSQLAVGTGEVTQPAIVDSSLLSDSPPAVGAGSLPAIVVDPPPLIDDSSSSFVDPRPLVDEPLLSRPAIEETLPEDIEAISLPVTGSDHWQETFVKAIKALDYKEWQLAADLMQDALGQKPASGELIRAHGFRYVAYIPHYYRGYALQKLGRCQEAMREWERSEKEGFVKSNRRSYRRLLKNRSECQEVAQN